MSRTYLEFIGQVETQVTPQPNDSLPKKDVKQSKAFQAYLAVKQKRSEVYRRLAES